MEEAAKELGVGPTPAQSPIVKNENYSIGFEATPGDLELRPRHLSRESETRLLEELRISIPQSSAGEEDVKEARLAELDMSGQREEERAIWAKS